MHRIDTNGHVSNLFDSGDPGVPRLPTQVDKHWLNAVQEEIANAILSSGQTLAKGTNNQLALALQILNPVRASGQVKFNAVAGSAPAVVPGSQINISGASLQAGVPTRLRVSFSTALANADYVVQVTDAGFGGSGNPVTPIIPTVITQTTGYFEIKLFDTTGTEIDVATVSSRALNVTVLLP